MTRESRAAQPRRRREPTDAVLFDFDGTLFDTSLAISKAFNGALVEVGCAPVEEQRIASSIGRPLSEMFRTLAPEAAGSDRDVEACVSAYRALFFPLSVTCSKLMPTARETIEALAAADLALAVVTTRMSDGALHILSGHGLDGWFGAVVGLEHVTRTKPHPEPVQEALARLGVRPERAVMVGDTPDDVDAGRSAGTFTIGVTTGPYDATALRNADAVVSVLFEVLPILGVA